MQHKENMSGIFAKNQYKKIFKLQEMTEANNSRSNISLIFANFVTWKKTPDLRYCESMHAVVDRKYKH